MTTKSRLEIAGLTDVGCVRKNNEDSMGLDEELGLMIVADGMGGHNSGEVASEIAVSTVRDYARQMMGGAKNMVPEGGDPSFSVRGRQLEYFIRTANEIIYQKGRQFPKDAGMGTTVVAAVADDKSLTVAHVGDSRAYLYRNGLLTQLTDDHSLVGDQVKKGIISPEQAVKSNLQNILTRALGADAEVKVDVADHPLLPGDLVLLASDGLNKMLTDEEVAKVLATGGAAAKLVGTLVEMSRNAGGVDNITVVCARVPSREQRGLKGLVAKLFGD